MNLQPTTDQQKRHKNPKQNQRQSVHFVDIQNLPWEKRHTDPYIKMIWNSLIKVEPANSEKGIYTGFRTYPDGFREQFTVFGRD